VTWGVEDVDGVAALKDRAVVYAGAGAGTPQASLQATVLVRPEFVELRRDLTSSTRTWYVTAQAQLTVENRTPHHDTFPRARPCAAAA